MSFFGKIAKDIGRGWDRVIGEPTKTNLGSVNDWIVRAGDNIGAEWNRAGDKWDSKVKGTFDDRFKPVLQRFGTNALNRLGQRFPVVGSLLNPATPEEPQEQGSPVLIIVIVLAAVAAVIYYVFKQKNEES